MNRQTDRHRPAVIGRIHTLSTCGFLINHKGMWNFKTSVSVGATWGRFWAHTVRDLNYLRKFHKSDSRFSSVSNNAFFFPAVITAVLRKIKHLLFYILSMFLSSFYDDSVAYTVIWNAGYWIHALLDSEDLDVLIKPWQTVS